MCYPWIKEDKNFNNSVHETYYEKPPKWVIRMTTKIAQIRDYSKQELSWSKVHQNNPQKVYQNLQAEPTGKNKVHQNLQA